MKQKDIDAFGLLGELQADQPPPIVATNKVKVFVPKLNRGAQQQLYKSRARNILAWSEKGSGKTWGVLHKLVKHCVKHNNALAIILVRTRSMANKGGAWDKLVKGVLPEWVKGSGIVVSKVMSDSQHNEMIWIQNRHGGWSQVVLVSAPFSSQLRDRMPGYEPSFVFVDELEKCDSDEYYKAPAAQLGRRPGIPGEEQQYVAACNPAGPSSWIYKMFWEDSTIEETGEWDPDYEQVYFPVDANIANLPKGYLEHLRKVYKNDPFAYARLLGGEWIDRPSGDSIFGEFFHVEQHVRPLTEDFKPDSKNRLRPNPKYTIFLTVDSGSTHHSFQYVQWLPIDARYKWVVVDEVVILKRRLSYKNIVRILMNRLKFWFELVGPMPLLAVSDESAFNVYRPGAGSFDYMDMEREWNKLAPGMGLPLLKMEPCPKFDGSVKARIRCLQNALGDDEIIISSACKKTQAMMTLLESEKQKEGEPFDPERATKPRRSNHLHVFDSLTYLMLLGVLKPHKLLSRTSGTQKLIRVA